MRVLIISIIVLASAVLCTSCSDPEREKRAEWLRLHRSAQQALGQGDDQRAVDNLEWALRQAETLQLCDAAVAEDYLSLARLCAKEGRTEKLLLLYQKAYDNSFSLKNSGKGAGAWQLPMIESELGLAQTKAQLGEIVEAEARYKDALKLQSECHVKEAKSLPVKEAYDKFLKRDARSVDLETDAAIRLGMPELQASKCEQVCKKAVALASEGRKNEAVQNLLAFTAELRKQNLLRKRDSSEWTAECAQVLTAIGESKRSELLCRQKLGDFETAVPRAPVSQDEAARIIYLVPILYALGESTNDRSLFALVINICDWIDPANKYKFLAEAQLAKHREKIQTYQDRAKIVRQRRK